MEMLEGAFSQDDKLVLVIATGDNHEKIILVYVDDPSKIYQLRSVCDDVLNSHDDHL